MYVNAYLHGEDRYVFLYNCDKLMFWSPKSGFVFLIFYKSDYKNNYTYNTE